MSAVQDTARQRHRGLRGLVARPSCYPLLPLPLPLLGYILSVLACYLGLAGWEAPRAALGQHGRDLFELLERAGIAAETLLTCMLLT